MGKQVGCHRIQDRQTGVSGVGDKIVLRVIKLDTLSKQCGEISVTHGLGENTGRGYATFVIACALVVTEEKQLVLQDGSAHTHAEFVYRRARLAGNVSRRIVGMKKVVGGVEQGTVPYLVQVSMELVGSRFGEVVGL